MGPTLLLDYLDVPSLISFASEVCLYLILSSFSLSQLKSLMTLNPFTPKISLVFLLTLLNNSYDVSSENLVLDKHS